MAKNALQRRNGTTVKGVNTQTSLRLYCIDNIAILQLNRNNSLVSIERLQSLGDLPRSDRRFSALIAELPRRHEFERRAAGRLHRRMHFGPREILSVI